MWRFYFTKMMCGFSCATWFLCMPITYHFTLYILLCKIVAVRVPDQPESNHQVIAEMKGFLAFIRSQRGAPLLTQHGYVYRCERHTGERSYWLCIRYKTMRCGGRLICQGNDVVKFTNHNHSQDWSRIDRTVIEYKSLTHPHIEEFLNSFKAINK